MNNIRPDKIYFMNTMNTNEYCIYREFLNKYVGFFAICPKS